MGTDGQEEKHYTREPKIHDLLIDYAEGRINVAGMSRMFRINIVEMTRLIKYLLGENEWKKLQSKRREVVRRSTSKWAPL